MDDINPSEFPLTRQSSGDLAARLARYRRRLEAEGRLRAVTLVDRAIEAADKKAKAGR